jgi:hypothetical protein
VLYIMEMAGKSNELAAVGGHWSERDFRSNLVKGDRLVIC